MKAVFDTNVLISAFVAEGICTKILLRAKNGDFELYTCPVILKEVRETLKDKFSATESEVKIAQTLIMEVSSLVNPDSMKVKVRGVCRDSDDDHILSCAISAEADFIVTGDSDLLTIRKYKDTRIIKPKDFEMLFGN